MFTILSSEDLGVEEPSLVAGDESESPAEAVAESGEVSQQLADADTATEVVSDAAEQIEENEEIIEQVENGEAAPEEAQAAAEETVAAVESFTRALMSYKQYKNQLAMGREISSILVSKSSLPSTESISSNPLEALKLANEGLKEFFTKAISRIKEFFKMIFDKMGNLYKRIRAKFATDAKKVKEHPEKSTQYHRKEENLKAFPVSEDENLEMTGKDKVILIIFASTFGLMMISLI